MEINVLNDRLEKIAVVDNFSSLMWCKRYNDVGALDLEVEASPEMFNLFKSGYYITRDDDDSIYRIKGRQLSTLDTGEDSLVIGALDCQSILNQRIIWEQTNYKGTVEGFIRRLVQQNIIAPGQSGRVIRNFRLKDFHGYTEEVEQQVTYDNLGEKITEMCQSVQMGYKVTYENGYFYFDLYKGVDRSINQEHLPKLVFSHDYENLINSDYTDDMTDYKNVALVGGEGEGDERKKRAIGTAQGLERYETFIDASSLSSNVEGGDLVDYYEALIAEGKQKLAEMKIETTFESEVDPNYYEYKHDYFLGDIVTIKNKYGITVDARITEIIETWDATGYTIEPKFEYDPIEAVETLDGTILTENGVALLSEDSVPLMVENVPQNVTISGGKKISELTELNQLDDGCCLPIVHGNETRKVRFATIKESVLPTFKINEDGDLIAKI